MSQNETSHTNNKSEWTSVLTTVILIGGLLLANYIVTNSYDPDTDGENGEFQRTDVTVEVAYQMIMNSKEFPDLIILDVRTQGEYDEGHLNNSILVPHDEIASNIDDIIQYQNTTVLMHCRSGSRSVVASTTLLSYNFSKIYNMLGGYNDWVAKGYPTVV
ncbi:MAG: rhodanese-like domain-containing protein [Promethearchaeota archaeon]